MDHFWFWRAKHHRMGAVPRSGVTTLSIRVSSKDFAPKHSLSTEGFVLDFSMEVETQIPTASSQIWVPCFSRDHFLEGGTQHLQRNQVLPGSLKLSTQNNPFEEELGGRTLLQAAKARGAFPWQTLPISCGHEASTQARGAGALPFGKVRAQQADCILTGASPGTIHPCAWSAFVIKSNFLDKH